MAIIVQDADNPVSNATGYVDLVYFKAYCDARGYDYSSYNDSQIEVAVLKGTEYLDYRFDYVGSKSDSDQNTEFPRSGYGIPDEVKHSCCEYGFRALSADLISDPSNTVDGKRVTKKSESISGVFSESYEFDYDDYAMPDYPVADLKLKKANLIKTGNIGVILRG